MAGGSEALYEERPRAPQEERPRTIRGEIDHLPRGTDASARSGGASPAERGDYPQRWGQLQVGAPWDGAQVERDTEIRETMERAEEARRWEEMSRNFSRLNTASQWRARYRVPGALKSLLGDRGSTDMQWCTGISHSGGTAPIKTAGITRVGGTTYYAISARVLRGERGYTRGCRTGVRCRQPTLSQPQYSHVHLRRGRRPLPAVVTRGR